MKYRHKPTIVEAMLWDGNYNSFQKLYAWAHGEITLNTVSSTIVINRTGLIVSYGTWIIQTATGELYPCSAADFEASYEQLLEVEDEEADMP